MKQAIGITMGIDLAPFWGNLFLYSYEEEYTSSLSSCGKIKVRHFHFTKRFINDLCAINDAGVFGGSICELYSKELELKVEHLGDYATFLNLDITTKGGTFIYNLLDKRDTFPFSIVKLI